MTVEEDCQFQKVDGLLPGTTQFNDVYGDCYISGKPSGSPQEGLLNGRGLTMLCYRVYRRRRLDWHSIHKGLGSCQEGKESYRVNQLIPKCT